MTNRAFLPIAFAFAIFAMTAGSQTEEKPSASPEKAAATDGKSVVTEEKAPARPVFEPITITPKEPVAEKPLESIRPRFRWAAESAPGDVTYDVVLWEVGGKAAEREEAAEGKEPKVVFERRGLRESELAYPESGAPLDKTKFYAWAVVANDSRGNQVGRTITPVGFLPFPPLTCWGLLTSSTTLSYCQQATGNSSVAVNWTLITFPSGSSTATWTVTDPNNIQSSGTVNCSGAICSGSAPISWPASQPGTYQGTLKVTRGNCTRSTPITLSIYPNIQVQVLDYPSNNPTTNLCWGEDATLQMTDVNGNPPPAGCQVTWEYSANNGSTWKPLGQGNPFNTNPITSTNPLFNGLSCTVQDITLQFRGTLDPNCPLPLLGQPPNCSNVKITSLKVTCPTQPGTITASPGPKICNANAVYPFNVPLNLVGNVGTVAGWTASGPCSVSGTGTSATGVFTGPGICTFGANVQNAPCPAQPSSLTVTVEDPIKGSIQVTQNGTPNQTPEVCWGDDKVEMTFVPTKPLPAGAILTWEYQINCAGAWTASGVTGTAQNSNDLILTPFYPPVNPCLTDKVCWRLKTQTQAAICPPTIITPVTINVVKPFNKNSPPVISPAQPPVKCPGQPVTLTASNYNNCATGPFSFQWYLDGLPIPFTTPSISAVDPGNYAVEVCNKNKCDCIETAPVTVRDCITEVEITGPCCKMGQTTTLTASIVSSQVFPGGPPGNCGGPFTYLWSTGATTASIQISCPSTSGSYWVEVTNGMGCKTKVVYPVKGCQ
jgi:hypothetical protein